MSSLGSMQSLCSILEGQQLDLAWKSLWDPTIVRQITMACLCGMRLNYFLNNSHVWTAPFPASTDRCHFLIWSLRWYDARLAGFTFPHTDQGWHIGYRKVINYMLNAGRTRKWSASVQKMAGFDSQTKMATASSSLRYQASFHEIYADSLRQLLFSTHRARPHFPDGQSCLNCL